MQYFKVIQNEEVVNIGCAFLKWNTKRKKLFICDVNEAQFLQSLDEQKLYNDGWLREPPKKGVEYENAKIVAINETEFNDIQAALSEGEQITVEQPQEEYPQTPREYVEEQEEKPMTIAEMREMIRIQQKQIEALMDKLQN